MKTQVVIAGLGGQGIVLAARVLAEAAHLEGSEVLCSETHGMAQRGGSVLAHVRIGGFRSPAVPRGCADAALCLSPTERDRARAYLRPDGAFVEAESNMELLGRAAAACAGLPSADAQRAAIAAVSRDSARHLDAFARGFES